MELICHTRMSEQLALDLIAMQGLMRGLAADFYMSLYNVIFTVLPPLVIGIFDQDVDREMSRLYPGQLIMSFISEPQSLLAARLAQQHGCTC